MKLFDCKVRLQGSPLDEVFKPQVTAAEIKMLRLVHGDDAVVEPKEVGEADRGEAEERERLAGIYGGQNVVKLFGVQVQRIDDDIDISGEVPPEPKVKTARRTRVDGLAAMTE